MENEGHFVWVTPATHTYWVEQVVENQVTISKLSLEPPPPSSCNGVNLSGGEDTETGRDRPFPLLLRCRLPSHIPMNQITFTIPSLPPSINALYDIDYRRRRVELKPAARQWKSSSKEYVLRFTIAEDSMLAIDFVFHYSYYNGRGNLRIFDSANLTKLAIDCICEKLGVNDCRVKSGSWSSVDSEKEFVEVTLREIVK